MDRKQHTSTAVDTPEQLKRFTTPHRWERKNNTQVIEGLARAWARYAQWRRQKIRSTAWRSGSPTAATQNHLIRAPLTCLSLHVVSGGFTCQGKLCGGSSFNSSFLFQGRRGATRRGATDASAVLPRPPQARAQHRDSLKAAGYEDIDDFANFDTEDLSVFKDALQKVEVPPGHIQKIVKAIQKLQHKPVRATDGDSRQCQGTTSPSAASPSAPSFQSPAAARGVDGAAEQAGQAAALHETSKHSAKVMAWLNTTAGRVIYGRHKPHVKLTTYQNNGDGSGSNGGGVGGGLRAAAARRARRQRRRLGQRQRRRARRRWRWRR